MPSIPALPPWALLSPPLTHSGPQGLQPRPCTPTSRQLRGRTPQPPPAWPRESWSRCVVRLRPSHCVLRLGLRFPTWNMAVKTRSQSPTLCLGGTARGQQHWLPHDPPFQMSGFWVAVSADRGVGTPPRRHWALRGPAWWPCRSSSLPRGPPLADPSGGPALSRWQGRHAAESAAVISR